MGAAEQRFEALVEELVGRPGVAVGGGKRGFGSDALQVNGGIFAMVSRGRLVLKLPRPRVAALISEGAGQPFDAGKGKPLAEWVTLVDEAAPSWRELAQEALAFAGGKRR